MRGRIILRRNSSSGGRYPSPAPVQISGSHQIRDRLWAMQRFAPTLLVFLIEALLLSFIDTSMDNFLCAFIGAALYDWASQRL